MPTIVQPLVQLVETALATPGTRNLTGPIQNPAELFKSEAAAAMDASHPGVFAYLSFHPKIDHAVSEYLATESLGPLAGPDILVLFTLEVAANRTRRVTLDMFGGGIHLAEDEHPSYEFTRLLLAPNEVTFPGVIFFERLSIATEPIFVTLKDASSLTAVANSLAQVFAAARHAHAKSAMTKEAFFQHFVKQLALSGQRYEHRAPKTVFEILVVAFQKARRTLPEIVSVVGGLG